MRPKPGVIWYRRDSVPKTPDSIRVPTFDAKDANGAKDDARSKLSFEEILSRLSGVVEKLEDGEIPLEHALQTFEQGIALSRLGGKRLDEAEQRIELLLRDEAGGVQTRPFQDAQDAQDAPDEEPHDE